MINEKNSNYRENSIIIILMFSVNITVNINLPICECLLWDFYILSLE